MHTFSAMSSTMLKESPAGVIEAEEVAEERAATAATASA